MNPFLIALLFVLLVMAIASFPTWSYAANWGYGTSGLLSLIIVSILLLFFIGKL